MTTNWYYLYNHKSDINFINVVSTCYDTILYDSVYLVYRME